MPDSPGKSSDTDPLSDAPQADAPGVHSSGWSVAQSAHSGPRSPNIAGGSHSTINSQSGDRSSLYHQAGDSSRYYNQSGDGSSIHIGDYLEQRPSTQREKEARAWGATWGLRAAAVVAVIANICTITGLPSDKLQFAGLSTWVENIRRHGFLSPEAPAPTTAVMTVFVTSLGVLVLILVKWWELRQRKYVMGLRGKIYERRHGKLMKSRITGRCLIPYCGDLLRLRNVEVGRTSYMTTDSQGRTVQKERSKKDIRLVCAENPDHRFPFDRTNVRESV